MATREIHNNLKIASLAVPAVRTTTLTSSAVDALGYESCEIVFHVGDSGDTLSGVLLWTLSLTECATSGGSYTAVAAADVLVQGGTQGVTSTFVIDAPTEDQLTVKFGYIGDLQFVKGVATATGSHSTGTPIGIIAVQGNAHILPVA